MLNPGQFSEELVVYYDDAVFSICYLITGPEFPYYKYDANKETPIAKWWSNKGYEQEDEDSMGNTTFIFLLLSLLPSLFLFRPRRSRWFGRIDGK